MSFWLTVAGMVAVTFGSRYAGPRRCRTELPDVLGALPPLRPDRRLRGARHAVRSQGGRGEGEIRLVAAAVVGARGLAHAQLWVAIAVGHGGVLAAADPVLMRPAERLPSGAPAAARRPAAASAGAARAMRPRSSGPSSAAEPLGERSRSSAPATEIQASASASRSAGIAPAACSTSNPLGDEVVHLAQVRAKYGLRSPRPRPPR